MNLKNKSPRKVIIWEVAKVVRHHVCGSPDLTHVISSCVSLGLVVAEWSQLAKHYVISLFRKVAP